MPPKMTRAAASAVREKQQMWFQNLILLDFPVHETEKKHMFTLNERIFDKPHKSAFEVISHFLFCKWDTEKSAELFKNCYPTFDKKRSQLFRTVCLNLWRRITEENPNFNIPRMTTTVLMSPHGAEVHKFLASFSTFVLFTVARRLDKKGEENTLLPPIHLVKSKSLAHDQASALKSACHSESLECIHNMQVSRHADTRAKNLADDMVQECRDFTRRKKQLLEANKENSRKLNRKTAGTPSQAQRSFQSPHKSTKMDTQTKSAVAHLFQMWERIFEAAEATNNSQDVVASILHNDKERNILSASALSPKVPSTLLRQCTSEVYERVGASLYETGQLNLVSLVSLFNLSLHLMVERLHEVGVPNFENQIPYIDIQAQVHSENVTTLREMCKELRQCFPESERTVRHLEQLVDQRHEQQEKVREKATRHSNIPKPVLSSTVNPSVSAEKLGLLPPTPPLRFMQSVPSSSPCLKGFQPPPKEIPAWMLSDFVDHQDEIVTASSHLSIDGEVSEPVLKQGTMGPRHVVAKRALQQPQKSLFKPTNVTGNRRNVTLAARSPQVTRHFDSCKKPSSLPSTPVVARGDAKIEKVTSRTPEAMRKLVDQIVDYTMEEMAPAPWYIPSSSSPPVPADPAGRLDLTTQLDPEVFAPGDKIGRTPPLSPSHTLVLTTLTSTKENQDPNAQLTDSRRSPVSSRTSETGSQSSRTTSSDDTENKTVLPNVTLISPQYQSGLIASQNGTQNPDETSLRRDSLSTESSVQSDVHSKNDASKASQFSPVLPNASFVMPHLLDTEITAESDLIVHESSTVSAEHPNNVNMSFDQNAADFAVPSAPAAKTEAVRRQSPVSSSAFLGQSMCETIMEMEVDFSKYPSLMDMSLSATQDSFLMTPSRPEKDDSTFVPVGNLIEL